MAQLQHAQSTISSELTSCLRTQDSAVRKLQEQMVALVPQHRELADSTEKRLKACESSLRTDTERAISAAVAAVQTNVDAETQNRLDLARKISDEVEVQCRAQRDANQEQTLSERAAKAELSGEMSIIKSRAEQLEQMITKLTVDTQAQREVTSAVQAALAAEGSARKSELASALEAVRGSWMQLDQQVAGQANQLTAEIEQIKQLISGSIKEAEHSNQQLSSQLSNAVAQVRSEVTEALQEVPVMLRVAGVEACCCRRSWRQTSRS